MKKEITEENRIEELKIQEQINDCLDEFRSFCFDAGAGAGKTYALHKSIEYILQGKGKNLRNRNQKILCITYTNAAKEELINRIGHNSEVVISTIHEFLWNFISVQQRMLVEQNKKAIENEQAKIQELEDKFLKKHSLDKNVFEEKISNEQFLNVFYSNYSKKATPFKTPVINYDVFFDKCFGSVDEFKKVVRSVNKLDSYQEALEKHPNEIKVEYNPTRNRDDLAKYIISHDSLLEYCKNIIEENNILQRLLVNSYPYIFIDEYQDTDKKVIDIISSAKEYASNKNKKFVVGYFGDSLQNIYENGVGNLPKKDKYTLIRKKFNRRSTHQIISVIGRIRNDGFNQKSIYKDNNGDLCRFYLSSNEVNLEKFLKQHRLNVNTACLLLKNKDICEKRGFEKLLAVISETPRFSGGNRGNLNSEFLQKNEQYIGWFFREILSFIKFIIRIFDDNSTVNKLIDSTSKSTSHITFNELSRFIKAIRHELANYETMALGNCIEKVNKIDSSIIRKIFFIDHKVDDPMSFIKNSAFEYLYFQNGEYSEFLDKFFEIKFNQFKNWYDYIYDENIHTGISYYTLHGSKGLEFENVVVVLQDDFARKKDYCRYFFSNFNNTRSLNNKDQKRFNQVRNLLYVACSRAKEHLYVIYETQNYKDSNLVKNIKDIFPVVEHINTN